MSRSYGSFLLRCWQRDDEQRIEIEHIQSHERTRVATVAAAVEWICAHASDRPIVQPEVVDALRAEPLPSHDVPAGP